MGNGWMDGYSLDCYDYWNKRGANNQECFHKVDKQTEGHNQSASSSLWDIFNKLTNNEYC